MSRLRFGLPLVCLLAACDHSGRQGDGGVRPDAGCVEGSHHCDNGTWYQCQGGVFTNGTACTSDQVCSDDRGCTACLPGKGACSGDKIVQCNDNGYPSDTVLQDCSPLTCAIDSSGGPMSGDAICIEPCDAKALAKSYTGCVYYAVDLPQWSIPTPLTGAIASEQQFSVAVANPWTVPIDVVAERDDAPPGSMVPQVSQVLKQTVPPGQLVELQLPEREVSGYVKGKRNRSLLSANAYRITTSRPASVYQFNPQNNPGAYSNDASLLIPQNALDESYLVLGWPGSGGDVSFQGLTVMTDNRPFITVVATQPNTKVRVTPSTEVMAGDNVTAMHKGMSYTFDLDEFDTLNLEGADFSTAGMTDFTGTRIEANGPLAVWSGVECITINPMGAMSTCCCDHLEEQLFPRSSLGADYVVVRSECRNLAGSDADPEFFRVLALDDATDVTTNLPPPDDKFTLAAGAMHEMVVTDDFIVHASKSVMIGQFQVSQDSSLGMDGDPSFELVPPVAQHRSEYIFLVPTGYEQNYLLISIPSNAEVTIDGQTPGSCERGTVGPVNGMSYDAERCPITAGQHTIASSALFGLVVEGWGPGPVSYGYTGGMEFKTITHDCNMDGDCPQAEFCSGGTCVPTIQ
jgi:hypothetical protein